MNNKIDWNKIFMGAAVAIVFVMQQYHSIKLSDLKDEVVPRVELQKKHDTLMAKDEILFALDHISKRIDILEGKDGTASR